MSGYRRYSKSRYGYRRRRYYSYRYRRYGMSTTRKANIAYRSTRKMVKRQEVKTYETFNNSPDITSVYTYSNAAKVPQGTTEDSRIGNSISPTSWKLRINLMAHDGSSNPIASNFTKLFRIMLVVWKGEGDPTINDILDGGVGLFYAMKNDQYKFNSKILYDKIHKIDSQVQTRDIHITIKRGLRRYPVTLQGASSPVTYRMNGYHLFIIPDASTVPGQVHRHLTSRLVFKDN